MRIGVITDVHISPVGVEPISWHSELKLESAGERYSAALAALGETEPDVIVVLGDLTHLGDAESMAEFVERSGEAACRVLMVEGNHDVVPNIGVLHSALATAQLQQPNGAMADQQPIDILGTPFFGVGVEPIESPSLFGATNLPSPDSSSIVLSHFPVLSLEEVCRDNGLLYAGDLVNRAELEASIAGAGSPMLVLAGHIHVRAAVTHGSILQLSFGALVEAPFDVSVVDVSFNAGNAAVSTRTLSPDFPCPAAIGPRESQFEFGDAGWRPRG